MNSRLNNRLAGFGYSVVRSTLGVLVVCHGLVALAGLRLPGFGASPGWPAALIEVVAGLFVAVGLFTRVAAVVCLGAVTAQFSSIFLLVALVGSGPGSVDALWRQRRATETRRVTFTLQERPQ